jgi:hypothetical protein
MACSASMLCGSPRKTCLLPGQRRRMLASHSTDPRLMGLDIATTIYLPSRIESGRGVFATSSLALEPIEASASPWERYQRVIFLAC